MCVINHEEPGQKMGKNSDMQIISVRQDLEAFWPPKTREVLTGSLRPSMTSFCTHTHVYCKLKNTSTKIDNKNDV